MNIKEIILNSITSLLRENLTVKNEHEETIKSQEKKTDEILCDFLTVIDSFERAEQIIKEKKLVSDEDSNTQMAMNRLLNAKRKALSVLEKYDVKRIVFENNKSVAEYCEVSDTEPDANRETGDIVSIEKQGYTRHGYLLRPAEVIIVKN